MKGIKLAKLRERKNVDLDNVKCIKSDDQKVLVKDNDYKERSREYFNKILNEDSIGGIRKRDDTLFAGHTF